MANNVGIPCAGADPLDRLLAVARAAVIQAIVCHLRTLVLDQAPDGREDIDRIVDRFLPSFPWLGSARIAIEQAVSGGGGPKQAAGEKRSRASGARRGRKRKRRGPDPGGETAKEVDEIEGAEENVEADRNEISKREESRGRSNEYADLNDDSISEQGEGQDRVNNDNDADLFSETSARGGSEPPNDLGLGGGSPTLESPRAALIPWSERIAACREYYAKHGHLDIKPKDTDLGHYSKWLQRMRDSATVLEKGGKGINGLNPSRLADLREVGFRSMAERRDERFRHMLAELEKYKAEHGHCDIPSTDASVLGKWVRYTKAEHARLLRGEQSPLSSMEIAKLTEIGLVLPRATRGRRRTWEEWMELCRFFLAENGHLKIPRSHPTLGHFCGHARNAYRDRQEGRPSALLTDERERELEEMGFVWQAGTRRDPEGRRPTRTFDEWFALLLEFREEHGHVVVPQHHPGGLGAWVAHMRTGARCLRSGRGALRGMTHERYMRLADVGFVFDVTNLRGRRTSSG